MTTLRLDQAALKALMGSESVLRGLEHVGEQVAERAAQSAPKDSGEGAASIRAERVGDEVRVSWDRDHFYLLFAEVGTSRQPARPFLRPALDAQYGL